MSCCCAQSLHGVGPVTSNCLSQPHTGSRVWLFLTQFEASYTAGSVSVNDYVSTFMWNWWSLAPVWYNWLIIHHLTRILQNPWLCASVPVRIDAGLKAKGSNTKYWFDLDFSFVRSLCILLIDENKLWTLPFLKAFLVYSIFSHMPKTFAQHCTWSLLTRGSSTDRSRYWGFCFQLSVWMYKITQHMNKTNWIL